MELAGAGIVLAGAGAVLWGVAARISTGAGALKVRGNIRILSHHRDKPALGHGKASGAGLPAYLRSVGAALVFAGAMIFWTLLVRHFFE